MRKKTQWTLLMTLLVFIFTACSRIDLAVYFADNYVVNRAEHYFDLRREQARWLKKAVKADISMIKKTIFPQLAQELLVAADKVNDTRVFDSATVQLSYERVKNLFYEGLRFFSRDAVLFADKLESFQVDNFQKEFDKKMREVKEDDNPKDRYKRIKKHFDSWMGSMTHLQKKELEDFVEHHSAYTQEKIYSRVSLAHEFVRVYPDKVARAKFVEGLMTRYESMRGATYSKLDAQKEKEMVDLVTSLLNKMNDSQREVLIETLRQRANQLIRLSKE